jgi:hypothetical protein
MGGRDLDHRAAPSTLRAPLARTIALGRPFFRVSHVRGVEVRDVAEALTTGGKEIIPIFGDERIRIWPRRIVGQGIEGECPYAVDARSIA